MNVAGFRSLSLHQKVNLIETENRIVVTRDWEGCGMEKGERMVTGTGVQLDRKNDV